MKSSKTYLPSTKVDARRRTIRSFKAKANARRSTSERFADFLTRAFGTTWFFVANALFFVFWILWNTDMIPGMTSIDPFPFGFLTMVVSLEAIFLAIVVLISQNREARIAELREEVELYINTYAENEITKLLYLQGLLLKKHGVDISEDIEVQEMLKNLEADKIEHELEKQL
jgi:uncharacterized membrane protein